jgi:hypothetical protein
MPSSLTRRRFLHGAALTLGSLPALDGVAEAAARGPQVYGVGRIQMPLDGRTVPSPSDFGFAASSEGGTFVCSMFGPETGGFRGCNLMTVQGVVTPGTLRIRRRTVTFAGEVDIFLFPDVFTPGPYLNSAANDFTVTATLGGPGKATMILTIPSVTAAIGGDTGGIVEIGRIERKRVRR